MNKLARNIVIFGAVIIAILLIVLYFASRKMLQEVESRLNQGMEFARVHVEEAQSNQYGIQRFEYKPFECSGLMDYKCKSEEITLYMDDFAEPNHNVHEAIQFYNFTLTGEDIKSRNHLSFKVKTDIKYPTMNRLFGDSTKDSLTAFFNHSVDSLLPNKLECEQEYLYTTDEDTPQTVTADTKCTLISQIFNTRLESVNAFTPNVERAHIIGILYDIAMAMNGDSNKEELQAQNIPHELLSLKFNIQPKQSFNDFIASNDKLTAEQKDALLTQSEVNLSLMRLIGTPFLTPYIGESSQVFMQGLSDVMQNKIKEFDVQLILKNPPNFQPLIMFKNMNVMDWLDYFNKNYKIMISTK